MPKILQLEHALDPITALTFVEVWRRLLLLAGEGSCLKVFDHAVGNLIIAENVFDSQAIHGIAIQKEEVTENGRSSRVTCLVWGGRSLCVIELAHCEELTVTGVVGLQVVLRECRLDDWILDAAFRPPRSDQRSDTAGDFEIVLLTSQNLLFSLRYSGKLAHEISSAPKIKELAAGPRSVLYSAHVVWVTPQRLLVAAGTVFGEVMLWSTKVSELPGEAKVSASAQLLHTFLGHEGSIFGVRISRPLEGGSTGSSKKILASCSDDRTIRLWDVSEIDMANSPEYPKQNSSAHSNETGFGSGPENVDGQSKRCLAKAMGHSSRIWGLRILSQKPGFLDILSYGEDSTTRIWRFAEANMDVGTGSDTLSHQSTFAYHSGKNIWASDVVRGLDSSRIVATGGADGRIVSYHIFTEYSSRCYGAVNRSWTMQEAVANASAATNSLSSKPYDGNISAQTHEHISRKAVFAGLEGKWQLVRQIKSVNPSYPSGTFEGTALFEERIPSDNAYNAEYLYIEDGHFKTDRDLSFPASRRYVYRYQAPTDQISVWFVKPADGSSVDYQFHILDFRAEDFSTILQPDLAIAAGGYHLCVNDDYRIEYNFQVIQGSVSGWHLQYIVKGPNKDYIAHARYQRVSSFATSSTSQNPLIVTNKKTKANGQSGGYHLSQARKPKPDNFKSYSWLNGSSILVTTEHGLLFVGSLRHELQKTQLTGSYMPFVSWEIVGQIDDLGSYSIVSSMELYEMAAFTGNEGTVYLYQHRHGSIISVAKLQHKISRLFAEVVVQSYSDGTKSSHGSPNISIVAYCLGSVTAHVLVIDPTSGLSENQDLPHSSCYKIEIDLPSTFMVTSSCVLLFLELVILGSRSGAISFHNISKDSELIPVSQCIRHVHGDDAVTKIKSLPCRQLKDVLYLLTTGRDGRCVVHRAESCTTAAGRSAWKVQTVHTVTPPFGPSIEGASFGHKSNDLLLWGFRSKQFVVWNASTNLETMVVECGGSHRSWAYSPSTDGEGGGNFAWTKASTCNIYTQDQASHRVFQYGSHGREIKALAVSTIMRDGSGVDRQLIATGAEDTAIRVCAYDGARDSLKKDFRCYGIFTKHMTGIQQLRWSPNGRYLFSAAGCEEFFAWRIRPTPYFGFGVVCEAVCPPFTESADLRIMSFDLEDINQEKLKGDQYILSMLYSDSSICIYRYTAKEDGQNFHLLRTGSYTTCCFGQAIHLHPGSQLQLCTASTDGHIAFWSIMFTRQVLMASERGQSSQSSDSALIALIEHKPLRYLSQKAIHQNSIKSMTSIQLSSHDFLIVTGGDDCTLAFTRLNYHSITASKPPVCSKLLVPRAHAAAISGIGYIGTKDQRYMFVTASNDQVLSLWCVTTNLEKPGADGVEVAKGHNVSSTIADVSSMEVFVGEDGKMRVVLVGIGMEVWKVSDLHLELG